MQNVNNKGNFAAGEEICENSLYFPINVLVNLKRLQKIVYSIHLKSRIPDDLGYEGSLCSLCL
jgi:hypothetical protein